MDKILIKGLKLFAHHGVLPEERRDGQTFMVDVVLHADLSGACLSGRLADTINYAEVAECIRTVMTSRNDDLIETVAQRIADAILAGFPLVAGLDIAIKKPEAPMPVELEYAGVEISRWRK